MPHLLCARDSALALWIERSQVVQRKAWSAAQKTLAWDAHSTQAPATIVHNVLEGGKAKGRWTRICVCVCVCGTQAGIDPYDANATAPYELVSFTSCFHGRTMGALALTYKEQYKTPFLPMVPGHQLATYNDLESAAKV